MTSKRTKAFLLGATLALATVSVSPRARAQTPDELNAARALFQEAYQDEQEKRYEAALDKFQRVAKVRESPSVRYRIGSCLEALGRLREARDAFRALAAQHDTVEKKDQPITDSAAERARDLDKKIPRLVVKTPADAPADTRVTVDGASVPVGRPLELDPGDHVVNATATGMKPFEGHARLDTPGETPFNVAFESGGPAQPPPDTDHGKSTKTLGYVALGAGGVLLVTGIVLLAVRQGDISSIKDTCPNDVCPTASRADIQSKQDQAKTFGPVGATLGIVGAAAAGVGLYLVLRPSSSSSSNTGSPTSAPAGSVRIAPSVVYGGAMMGVGTDF